MDDQVALDVRNLRIKFDTDRGVFEALNDVSFSVEKGRTLGIVGESGSGKSITSLAIMRLLQNNAIVSGEVFFKGRDILKLNEKDLEKIRGEEISMIFQEPMTSLNPVFTIEQQIGEAISLHQGGSKKEIKQKVIDVLKIVGIPNPERRSKNYPHQLSGGMRQRVLIAMALACEPDILIADEPTTALDVTIQAQILHLIRELQKKFSTSVIFITHDLGVIAQVAQNVAVMYAGEIVEYAPVKLLFSDPLHPYTSGLLNTIPSIGIERLEEIKGMVPELKDMPTGCRFEPRCPKAQSKCKLEAPRTIKFGSRTVKCWLYDSGNDNGQKE